MREREKRYTQTIKCSGLLLVSSLGCGPTPGELKWDAWFAEKQQALFEKPHPIQCQQGKPRSGRLGGWNREEDLLSVSLHSSDPRWKSCWLHLKGVPVVLDVTDSPHNYGRLITGWMPGYHTGSVNKWVVPEEMTSQDIAYFVQCRASSYLESRSYEVISPLFVVDVVKDPRTGERTCGPSRLLPKSDPRYEAPQGTSGYDLFAPPSK